MAQDAIPRRPPAWEEALASRLFRALAPRLPSAAQPETPPELAPFEEVAIERSDSGRLSAVWYPATAGTRGAVLLLHPWMIWGKAYFHARRRIQTLRSAGYHVLTPDFSGFGASSRSKGFFDRDVEACLEFLRERSGGLPLHVWGVSFGGYWAHVALGQAQDVAGAVFEDVAPHMLEWSWRVAPMGRPFYLLFRAAFRRAYRYLDLRKQATALRLRAVLYVGGDQDPGIPPDDTRELASIAQGRHWIVAGAGHLGSIKVATEEILGMALATFQRAEAMAAGATGPSPTRVDDRKEAPSPVCRS